MNLKMSNVNELETRILPSFIEPSAPLITNPWMRPRPTHGRNLLDLFEKDSSCESDSNTNLFKVYLRLKPIKEDVSDIYKIMSDTSLLTVTSDNVKRKNKVNKMYNFSKIFQPESSQREIFEIVVRDNLLDLFENKTFTLLTYGSSGSGKTYTLMGTEDQPGLIPRTLEYMFQSLNPLRHPNFKTKDGSTVEKLNMTQKMEEMKFSKSITQKLLQGIKTYRRMSVRLSSDFQSESYLMGTERHSVWVSFCEIYNETINDLLITGDKTKTASNLKLCEDTKGQCYVKGLSQVYVRSSTEAYKVMLHGQRNLRYAETGIHSHSSRSHCLFTITLITHNNGSHAVSLLRLCDLAGSERAQQTGNKGERMKESRSINSSLAVLERCLTMLKNKQNHQMSMSSSDNTIAGRGATRTFMMPVRESKLTRLLGSSLTGDDSVTMLVAVNPERTYFQESQHVLKLSAIARQLWLEPSNEQSSCQDSTTDSFLQIQKESEIERLKFELSRATKYLEEAMQREMNMQAKFSDNMQEIVKEAQKVTAWKYEQRLRQQKEKYEDKLEDKDEIIKNLTESETMIKSDYDELENTLEIRERELEHWKTAFASLESKHEELRAAYERLHPESMEKDDQTDVTGRESVIIVEEPKVQSHVWVVDSESESEVSQSEEETEDEEDDVDSVEYDHNQKDHVDMEHDDDEVKNGVENDYEQQDGDGDNYQQQDDDQQHTRKTSLDGCHKFTAKCSDLFEDSMTEGSQNSMINIGEQSEVLAHFEDAQAIDEHDTEAVEDNKVSENSDTHEYNNKTNLIERDQDRISYLEHEDSMDIQPKSDISEEEIDIQAITNDINKMDTNNDELKTRIANEVIQNVNILSEQTDVNGNLEHENQNFNKEKDFISESDKETESVGNCVAKNDEKCTNEIKIDVEERSTVLTDIDTNIDIPNTTENNQLVTVEELKILEVNINETKIDVEERSTVLTDIDTNIDIPNTTENNQLVTVEELKILEVNINETKIDVEGRSTVLTDIDTNIDIPNTIENNQLVTVKDMKILEVNIDENAVPIKTPSGKKPPILGPETSGKKGRRRLWTQRAEEEVENADNEDESPSDKLVSKPKVPTVYGSRTRRRKNYA